MVKDTKAQDTRPQPQDAWTRPRLDRLGTIADVAGTQKRSGDVIPGTHLFS